MEEGKELGEFYREGDVQMLAAASCLPDDPEVLDLPPEAPLTGALLEGEQLQGCEAGSSCEAGLLLPSLPLLPQSKASLSLLQVNFKFINYIMHLIFGCCALELIEFILSVLKIPHTGYTKYLDVCR